MIYLIPTDPIELYNTFSHPHINDGKLQAALGPLTTTSRRQVKCLAQEHNERPSKPGFEPATFRLQDELQILSPDQ